MDSGEIPKDNLIEMQRSKNNSLQEIGAIIAKAREEKSFSVESLAKSLRIGQSQLEAIENGQQELLPEKVFVRGMIRRISERLSINSDELIKKFNEIDTGVVQQKPIQKRQFLKSKFLRFFDFKSKSIDHSESEKKPETINPKITSQSQRTSEPVPKEFIPESIQPSLSSESQINSEPVTEEFIPEPIHTSMNSESQLGSEPVPEEFIPESIQPALNSEPQPSSEPKNQETTIEISEVKDSKKQNSHD